MTMSWRQARRRIGRDEAERLLDGAAGPGHEQLAALLRAAAGPARPHELAGEDAAVTAFRQARTAPAGRSPARSSPARSLVRPGRRVGVLAGALAAGVLLAGTATAAGTGHLPDPLQRAAHDWFAGVGVPEPGPEPVAAPSPSPSRSEPPVVRSSAPSTAAASVSAARIDELCRAWQEGRGRKLTDAERRELAAAAQGEDRVEAFCKQRRGAGPAPTPSKTHPNDQGNQGNGKGNTGDQGSLRKSSKPAG
ncbi:hypothetical protein KZZ52_37830 [Dactylosporangium sp. AC04546]|uniref:hypothetical protein n=1 Tax=Dactylosporangium sp. AC04546 TaxID=2862460 RepID=UPI001EDDA055|nr:hypothetical protein [Dactylosporangium sp. AC04546]WVK79723.1 hypothetical protein KZZ52_37830 [Dactylosporangium sp. AC04546]